MEKEQFLSFWTFHYFIRPSGFLIFCSPPVINGLAGLVECKTKDKRTEVSRAEELTKEVNNWCLYYQTKVRGDSPSL